MTMAMEIQTINTNAVVTSNPFNAATLADWIQYCDVRPATQVTYDKAVKCFINYVKSNEIAKPERQDVINFREWLIDEAQGGYKTSTARMYLTVVKKFFGWLSSQGFYRNVADGVKLPKKAEEEHARDALTLEEAKTAIAHVDEKANKEMQLRNRAILSLMIGCGLRSIEVVRLNEGDLEKRRGVWFLNVLGKGKDSKVPVQLTPELKKILDDYRAVRGAVRKNSAMFISTARSNRGQRLQTQTISRLTKKTFSKVGIESNRVTCHSCRHTFITLGLQSGLSLRDVAKAARHADSKVTELYAHDLDRFNNKTFATVTGLLFN